MNLGSKITFGIVWRLGWGIILYYTTFKLKLYASTQPSAWGFILDDPQAEVLYYKLENCVERVLTLHVQRMD